MKRNQRTKYDYTTDYRRPKQTKLDSDQLQLKPKQTQSADLKSLECSSVHEVQPTNQSYEMSWLEKLVNNMDQDKQNNTYAEHPSRNFTRKNSINITSNYMPQKTNDNNKKNRNSYSTTKYENQYTPISKINEIVTLPRNQKYHVNQFKDSQNQRFTRTYLNSAEKYQLQRKYSTINPINYQAKQLNKYVDLNESRQSYGRIKRINKQKQNNQIHSKYLFPENLEQIQIPSAKPYLNNYRRQQKDRERIATQNSSSTNFYSYKPSYDAKDYLKQNSYKSYEKQTKNQFDSLKRKDSTYMKVGEEKPNYQSLSYKQKYESPIKMSCEYKQQVSGGQVKQTTNKLVQKEDDFKMDEMAKKLNMVLQNINKKSKMIAQPHQQSINKSTTSFSNSANTTNNFESKTELQPRTSSYVKQSYIRGSQNIWQRQKAQQLIRKQQPPSVDTKKIPSSSINNYCRFIDTNKSNLPSPNPIPSPSSTTNSSYHSVQPIQREHQKQQAHENKYQMMKKSLGMSKHIPHEIILQQSSSQINSQVTPRTQFLNRQLRIIFDKLDKNKTGELNKNNCGLQQISDEIKYIFGGIFSKIKYKGQKILFKGFLEQSQNIIKQFQFSELKQVFCKSNNVPHFQYHQKEVQSEKWNNQTNNDIQSKRSSDRSQVVKKYDFTQENIQAKYKTQNQHRLKVHWAAPMYRHTDVLNVEQITKQKKRETSKSPYQPKHQIRQEKYLEVKDENKKSTYANTSQAKTQIKTYLQEKSLQKQHISIEKQNSKTSQTQKEKKDFQKMCQNLNNKLNNYLTTITKKVSSTGPHIPLEFSQLSKHWSITKS